MTDPVKRTFTKEELGAIAYDLREQAQEAPKWVHPSKTANLRLYADIADFAERMADENQRLARLYALLTDESEQDKLRLALARELETFRVALRTLRDQVVGLWGDYEDCKDCSELVDHPCQIHQSAPLWKAMLSADEALGPCVCGHPRSQHEVEESSHCKTCKACANFRLFPVAVTTHD